MKKLKKIPLLMIVINIRSMSHQCVSCKELLSKPQFNICKSCYYNPEITAKSSELINYDIERSCLYYPRAQYCPYKTKFLLKDTKDIIIRFAINKPLNSQERQIYLKLIRNTVSYQNNYSMIKTITESLLSKNNISFDGDIDMLINHFYNEQISNMDLALQVYNHIHYLRQNSQNISDLQKQIENKISDIIQLTDTNRIKQYIYIHYTKSYFDHSGSTNSIRRIIDNVISDIIQIEQRPKRQELINEYIQSKYSTEYHKTIQSITRYKEYVDYNKTDPDACKYAIDCYMTKVLKPKR